MALITTWIQGRVTVEADRSSFRLNISEDGSPCSSNYIRLSSEEAVKLSNELSRAIGEAAQAKAKAVQAEGAQS